MKRLKFVDELRVGEEAAEDVVVAVAVAEGSSQPFRMVSVMAILKKYFFMGTYLVDDVPTKIPTFALLFFLFFPSA